LALSREGCRGCLSRRIKTLLITPAERQVKNLRIQSSWRDKDNLRPRCRRLERSAIWPRSRLVRLRRCGEASVNQHRQSECKSQTVVWVSVGLAKHSIQESFYADFPFPIPCASNQCISALRIVPSKRRTIVLLFSFRHRPFPYRFRRTARFEFECRSQWA
jgi:hypothetical protein